MYIYKSLCLITMLVLFWFKFVFFGYNNMFYILLLLKIYIFPFMYINIYYFLNFLFCLYCYFLAFIFAYHLQFSSHFVTLLGKSEMQWKNDKNKKVQSHKSFYDAYSPRLYVYLKLWAVPSELVLQV